ncbi:MAG: hypothetical protein GTO18_07875 [Anaerolineales bacterium]|nr:hypothetical protein [Anaerolineales bacterium]
MINDDGYMTLHPEFTADGKYVYLSDWQGDIVRVYDADTFQLITEITGTRSPTGIFNTSHRTETLGH